MSKTAALRLITVLGALIFSVAILSSTRPIAAEADAFSLTVDVAPDGKGSVNVNPPPPYTGGQEVTLTATPVAGWLFDKWVLASNLQWWDSQWDYRVAVTAGAAGTARTAKPAEFALNFTQLWASLGKTGTLDPNSIRVVEVNAGGDVIDETVAFQFDKGSNYNAATNAAGTLTLIMEGNTAADAIRRYQVYFDVTGKGFAPPNVTPQVVFTDNVTDEGFASYRMETPVGTYFFHKAGGGFSSFNDLGGNDWISWNSAEGSAGDFRGVPNAVTPNNGGFFHPGRNVMTSTLISQGPIKVTFESIETKTPPGGRVKWKARWEIYPTYARMTMLQAPYNYWFLYEGTPGGLFEGAVDLVVRSSGQETKASVSWTEDLSGEEWVYFVDPNVGRALYFASHLDDDKIDSYAMEDSKMTRLGIGRQGSLPLIDKTILPRYFTWGIMDETTFGGATPVIRNAYKDVTVTVGDAETNEGELLGTTNPIQFTITGEHRITAFFKPSQHTVTVNASPADKGTVTKTPNKPTYDHGEQVTLAAVPLAPGWYFGGWQGDVTGLTNPITVAVNKNMNVTALFVQAYRLTVNSNPLNGGTVQTTPAGPDYVPGTVVTLEAIASAGFSFTNWSGDLQGTNATETVVMDKDRTITANFGVAQYTFNATSSGNGTVDWAPKKPLYAKGEVVTVTATPNEGYYFAGWRGDITSGVNPLKVTMNGNKSVIGDFRKLGKYGLDLPLILR